MEDKRTLFQRARAGDFDTDNLLTNLNRCKEIANDLSFSSIVDNTSRDMGLIAELLYRVKNMPSVEYIDFESMFEEYYMATGGSRKGD